MDLLARDLDVALADDVGRPGPQFADGPDGEQEGNRPRRERVAAGDGHRFEPGLCAVEVLLGAFGDPLDDGDERLDVGPLTHVAVVQALGVEQLQREVDVVLFLHVRRGVFRDVDQLEQEGERSRVLLHPAGLVLAGGVGQQTGHEGADGAGGVPAVLLEFF